jgi:hypothetical protein
MPAGAKGLQAGQAVALGEGSWGWRLSVLAPGQAGHRVVAVESDQVVLEEEGSGATTRLPLYLIEAVVPLGSAAAGEAA